ncbi:Membrane metallo-endopeptidase-like 1, partial [Temnothorax longispinosus]
MFVTAADFQTPWFSYDRPRFVNFGIIGFILAHEVNHGFDNKGHLYDKNGERLGWLSAMAGEYYNKRQDCFVEQFNKYPIDKNTNRKI